MTDAPVQESGTDERWHLEDEAEFLRRSLTDAEAEHAAGDLSDEDFALLERRDRGRLAEVTTELAELEAAAKQAAARPGSTRRAGKADQLAESGAPKRRRARWLAVVGVVALVAGASALVMHLATNRLPGQASSGSITLSGSKLETEQLAQAANLVNQDNIQAALVLYRKILVADPNQPEALAESGWLEYEVGSVAKDPKVVAQGRALVNRAIAADPSSYASHLFLGTIILQQDHDAAAAVAQYKQFLADNPPLSEVQSAAPFIRQAYTQAGQPLPGSLSG